MVREIDRRRLVLTANAAVFVNFLSYLGLTPLYAQVANDLGVGAAGLGQYFLAQGLVSVILQVPVGVVADRYGRRPVMVAGLLIILAGQILRWQAYNEWIFLASQIAIGLGGPFVVSASYALIADVHPHGRVRALGLLQASINLGQGTGFLLAGLLGPWLGWRGYSLCVAALPLFLLPLTATQPESRTVITTAKIGRSILAALQFLAIPTATLLAIVAALNLGAGSGATYLLPFVANSHQLTPTATGLLLIPFLAASVVGGPAAGAWADRAGVRSPALACIGVVVAGLAGLALLPYALPTLAICLTAIGGGVSGVLTVTVESVVALANRRGIGTGAALGGIRIGQGMGPTLAPAMLGFIFDSDGPKIAFLAMAATMLLAAALVFMATKSPVADVTSA